MQLWASHFFLNSFSGQRMKTSWTGQLPRAQQMRGETVAALSSSHVLISAAVRM